MKVRPIDANLFAKSLEIEARSVGVSWVCDRHEAAAIRAAFNVAATKARQFPTLDYAPVVHGEWIEPCINKYGHPCHHCSKCGFKASQKDRNFCPNCGAKMDKEGQ